MSTMSRLGQQLQGNLKEQKVVVYFLGGEKSSLSGTIVTAQDDFLILALTDSGSPKDQAVIPFSAIAHIRAL